MAVDLQQLAKVLEASLDPSQNKQGIPHYPATILFNTKANYVAEIAILQQEKKSNFSLSLLQIVVSESYGDTARLASALYFKNYIKRHWTVSSHSHPVHVLIPWS